jgi:hypothetical protein
MNSETLVFNGINGATGSYGLPPMSGQALGERILEASRPTDPRESLQRLREDNADKLAELVKLLAETSVEPGDRDEAWQGKWVRRLARKLVDLFLTDEYKEPDRLAEIEGRLARHTLFKIEEIADLLSTRLSETSKSELAALLLKDPDERTVDSAWLSARVKEDAREKLGHVEIKLRLESRSLTLDGDATAQLAWLEDLLDDLRPIYALNSPAREMVNPLESLNRELDVLAGGVGSPSPGLDALRGGLKAQPPDLAWRDLLDLLHRGLKAIIEDRREQVPWKDLLEALYRWLLDMAKVFGSRRAVKEGIEPTDLAQAGWGIIFAYEDPQAPPPVPTSAIQQALQPLLDLRQSQAGARFKIYEGADGYRPNDTASSFASRHDVRVADPADPEKVPYYLLIVGSPHEIPFHFQYQLDVQYAVGRIHFDSLQKYANYARTVVAAETGNQTPNPRAAFFGPANHDDRATYLSAAHLVEPLFHYLQDRYGDRWFFDAILRDQATKARLLRLVGGPETPALLFAACHGMEFPKDDPKNRQLRHQGALLCQDWQGPEAGRGEVSPDHYLAGEHLAPDADLGGLIAFFFACYSAGTPRFDAYYKQEFRDSGKTITDRPFLAALPRAMLGRREGGALAVVGHVERVWGTSYLGPRQSQQLAVFEGAVERLLKGQPIGLAMEYFNGRYAALSSELTTILDNVHWQKPNRYELAELWTANNDARGYIVIGDPAVRLPPIALGSLPAAQTVQGASSSQDQGG